MHQLRQLFERITLPQRIWLAAAAVAVIGGITMLTRWTEERDFKPLFTGLAAEDAGSLVAKLRESGVEYRLADNGTAVLVPSGKVAEARLQMAAAGLPKSGRVGFELFDKTNFGTSEFAEQVNYHRAIEGELERSVMSIREVEQARVHVSLAKDSLYTEQRQPAKASVLVKLRGPAKLSPQSVAAICQLTASAVPGLSADQVSVIDTSGSLLNRPRPAAPVDSAVTTEAALDYRKSIERDVQNKVDATLEPLLGADHFRVGVSADVDLTSGEQSEEVFDPQKSVMVTSQRTEDGPAAATASGVPGTASSLPRSTSKPSTGSSNYARHTENVTYQTSRLVKHTRLPQGALKRLSLSVLVDYSSRWEGTKRLVEPPSPEKLKVIRELVSGATGLDPNRGDQLVVDAFPFESTPLAEPMPATSAAPQTPSEVKLPAWLQKLTGAGNLLIIAGIGAGALLALACGLWLGVRRGAKKKRAEHEAAAALEAGQKKELPPTADEMQQHLEARLAEQLSQRAKKEAEALMAMKLPAVATKKTEVLTKHIATESKKDPTAMAQVVRSWLDGENQR
jgi:flagellar M-ring protein FliF